jgi:hypothetical protein
MWSASDLDGGTMPELKTKANEWTGWTEFIDAIKFIAMQNREIERGFICQRCCRIIDGKSTDKPRSCERERCQS